VSRVARIQAKPVGLAFCSSLTPCHFVWAYRAMRRQSYILDQGGLKSAFGCGATSSLLIQPLRIEDCCALPTKRQIQAEIANTLACNRNYESTYGELIDRKWMLNNRVEWILRGSASCIGYRARVADHTPLGLLSVVGGPKR